jgi:HSP20 family protein
MQNAMDRWFNESLRGWRPLIEEGTFDANMLALDVHEDDKNFTVVTALPGVKPENIQVKLHDDLLSIEAEIPEQKTEKKEDSKVLLQERVYGKFSRRVRLPQPVNSSKVEAAYSDGVLTLTLPKAEEAQPKMIQIKTDGKK